MSEFNEFKPRLKSPQNRFQLSASLNLEKFNIKELSLCHKLWFSNFYTLQPNVVDLRYFKLWILLHQIILVWNIKTSGSIDIGIRTFEFVAKTQFLWNSLFSGKHCVGMKPAHFVVSSKGINFLKDINNVPVFAQYTGHLQVPEIKKGMFNKSKQTNRIW